MAAELDEKVDRYERLLAEALAAAAATPSPPIEDGAAECLGMARAYLDDGRHFRADGDPVNALAAYAYGHGWLDAAVRLGLVDGPDEAATSPA